MITWSLLIPVLSTAHAPSMGHIVNLCDRNASAADYREGFIFVYIDTEYKWEGREAWVAPIAAWMAENYQDQWLRFDSTGDIEESLPTYDW